MALSWRKGRQKLITSQPCDNTNYEANHIEGLIWPEIKEILTKPDVILGELECRSNEYNGIQVEAELASIRKRLAGLDKEQEQLLSWALKGFPEETVIAENQRINQYRGNLKSRYDELSKRVSDAKQNELDIAGLRHFCELAKRKIERFTFADKRLALEALRVEVGIDGDKIRITGAVPTCLPVSTQLK